MTESKPEKKHLDIGRETPLDFSKENIEFVNTAYILVKERQGKEVLQANTLLNRFKKKENWQQFINDAKVNTLLSVLETLFSEASKLAVEYNRAELKRKSSVFKQIEPLVAQIERNVDALVNQLEEFDLL